MLSNDSFICHAFCCPFFCFIDIFVSSHIFNPGCPGGGGDSAGPRTPTTPAPPPPLGAFG